MKKLVILLLITAFTSSCSTIEHTTNTEKPIGEQRIVGIGGVILRVNKQRNLENAFGKSDVFGRKTNEGYTELRFAGVEQNGEVVLYRKDTRIISNETTMSRTPISTTTGSSNTKVTGGYYGGHDYGSVNAKANTNYSSTTIAPLSEYHVIVPAETFPIRLAPNETKIPIEGYIVEIIKATRNSLEYKITKY